MVNSFALMLVLGGSFLGAIGIFFLKKATGKSLLLQVWKQPFFWMGLGMSGFSALGYLLALRQEELSVLYPLVSTTYLWTTGLAVLFLREKMNRWKMLSLGGIVIGIILVGLGS